MTLVREISETQVVRRLGAGRIIATAAFDGAVTPSVCSRSSSLGVATPVAALGGPQFLEAIAGAYPGTWLIPSGGVRSEALRAYAPVPAVLAVARGWIVRQDLVRPRNY